MKDLIIACEILRYELEKALNNIPNQFDIKWMDPNLHMVPDDLRTALQHEIDNSVEYENILFVYGICGNGLIGLNATTANLIIPKTADCISLILHNYNNLDKIRKDTYFLTKGWIESSNGIVEEYSYTVKKYGIEKAKRIMSAMLRNYKHLMLIDTEAYDIKPYQGSTKELANKLSLEMIIEKGDIYLVQKLLLKQWDDDFCVINKGKEVLLENFQNVLSMKTNP